MQLNRKHADHISFCFRFWWGSDECMNKEDLY